MAVTDQDESREDRRWTQRWPTIVLPAGLILGLTCAAVRATFQDIADHDRNLTILAPEQASLTVDATASRIPVVAGVHAFSVRPGPHRLELELPSGTRLSKAIDVPAGYGPLMLEITTDESDKLQVGYF